MQYRRVVGIVVLALALALAGCGQWERWYNGSWGSCSHPDGSCTEHPYEHECYEAEGFAWLGGYGCK